MAAKDKLRQNKSMEYIELLLQVNNDLAVTETLDQALVTLVNILSSIIGVLFIVFFY